MSKQFRDCNGESNGIALPEEVLQQEKFCDGNRTELGDNSLVRRRMVSASDSDTVFNVSDHPGQYYSNYRPGRFL